MANPTLLTTPLAENGDKNVIPATTSSTSGAFSQEKGWQQINSLPVTQGGIAPDRLDFNGAFNLLSKILFYAQKGWQFEYDEAQDYYIGCIVKDTDGYMYEALNDVSASSNHPKDDTTNWQKHDLSQYLPLDGGGALTGDGVSWNGYNWSNSAIINQTGDYIKYLGGVCMQKQSVDATGWTSAYGMYYKSVTLPISFLSATSYVVVANAQQYSGVNVTEEVRQIQYNDGGNFIIWATAPCNVRYFAFGY